MFPWLVVFLVPFFRCAPRRIAIDPTGNQDETMDFVDECREKNAKAAIGTGTGSVLGTLVGSVLGAVAGAFLHVPGEGAKLGVTLGAAIGGLVGLARTGRGRPCAGDPP
jgi:hypothetical protein